MADFIIKPASGDTLKLQDEGGDDAISISTTGVTTIANATIKVHSFSAYVTSQIQMAVDNTWYEVSTLGTWTERWDSGQFASGKFTPTKSGIYLCGYTVFTDQLDDTERLESVIRKNGSTSAGDLYAYSSGRMSVSSDLNQSYSGSSLVTFNGSSDYVSLWALHNQGQSGTYLDVSYNEFWATYIGEV